MTAATPIILDKAFALLDAIVADLGQTRLATLAASIGVPKATAYRLTAAMTERGLIVACGGGLYLPGLGLTRVASAIEPREILGRVATPFLVQAAKRFGQVCQLGVFEDGMVTYLVKTGDGGAAHFTRQGMQLEAYCSGLGKVLLANLPDEALEAYLSAGAFVRLTPNTIIEPDRLRRHLEQVRRQGFAVDDGEIASDLSCVAMPVRDERGAVRAAISLSAPPERLRGQRLDRARALLGAAALGIEQRLYRRAPNIASA